MNGPQPILGHGADDQPLAIDIDRLIGSHALAVANTGGGKSGLLRRLLEVTHGRVQQIVLDPEDELYTLREQYGYVIVGGEGADAPATVAGAGELALLALRHGFSMIVQLNDLGAAAADFVDAFLAGLLSAPQELWRPLLVAIDELQRFAAPGRAAGVEDLVFRGRKRGYTLIGATLRITKIDPSVRGMVNNWMLGRVGQTLDRNTMAEQLGFTAKEGRDQLRGLEPRQFWGVGPALTTEPRLFTVGDTDTTIVHRGQARLPTPPAPEALREILQGLAAAAAAPASEPAVTPKDPVEAYDAGRLAGEALIERDARIRELEGDVQSLTGDVVLLTDAVTARETALRTIRQCIEAELAALEQPELQFQKDDEHADRDQEGGLTPPPTVPAGAEEARTPGKRHEHRASSTSAPTAPAGEAIRGRKALGALVAYPALTEQQWAWTAGFSRKGGTWGTYKTTLRAAGLVEECDGRWYATTTGIEAYGPSAGEYPPLGPDLVRAWKPKIPGVGRMVDVLVKRWPEMISRDVLAAELGMAAAGGTFGTYLSRLRGHGFIQESGKRLRLNPAAMELGV